MSEPTTLTARWIFSAAGPPLPGGTVTLDGERIDAVEPHGRSKPDRDLGDVALLPGFVNAHTHLDLSGLRGVCPPTADFPAWLQAVIGHRLQVSPERLIADIETGLCECQRYGTTTIGDISGQGASWPILLQARAHCVVFRELLGLTEERAEAAWTMAKDWLREHTATKNCRSGLSPHAPYSVRSSLFERVAEVAKRDRIPVAVHVAESAAELELLRDRAGPFVPFLERVGVWDPAGLVESLESLVGTFDGAKHFIAVHGNHLLIPGNRCSHPGGLVYCPRTHAAFGHPPHPFREFLAKGVMVALGTDSLASNPDLDILAEARFVHRQYPEFSGEALLRMLTLNGARVLGFEAETGSLEPGKSADLVALPIENRRCEDPHALIFDSEAIPSEVWWRGEALSRERGNP